MQIGEVVEATGFSADTLRYYEKIGLMPRVGRSTSGRRSYDRDDLSRLGFIRRAQQMRFSLDEIKTLLQLRRRDRRVRASALELAERKLEVIETALADMKHLQSELELLVNLCRQTSGDSCPIIEKLNEHD